MRLNNHARIRPIRWLFLALLAALTLLLGLRPTASTGAAPASHAVFAANGRIAFTSVRDGNAEIYVMNADGSNPTRLTNNHPVFDDKPSWSPDGTKIAFRRDLDGGNNAEIYVMNADGSGQTPLTNNSVHDSQPAWSPDGAKIAFVREENGNQDIYLMNANGSGQTNLTESTLTQEREPAWSPDGMKLAFSLRNEVGGLEVYVMNADGSNPTNLTNFPTTINEEPTWSPNGAKIAFISWRDGGDSEIFVMNANGSNPTNLTNTTGTDNQPVWAPDGSQIAFNTDRDGNQEIYAMNANGSGQVNLTNNAAADYLPDWGPEAAVDDDDGVPAAVEDGAPNNGDGNDDGIPDSEQENVTSFPNNTDGSYVTLEEINGAQLNDVQAITNPSPADAPDVDFPIGFLDFRIAGVGPGGTAVLRVFLENDEPIDTYYKYGPTLDNPTSHWYEFLYDGTTGVKFEDDKILLHFKDGQRGDDDLDNNGVITDAGTLATCRPVTKIHIEGNSTVQVNQELVLRAVIDEPQNPTDSMTDPLTYKWTPDTTPPLQGGGATNQATYKWANPGNRSVTLKITNCNPTGKTVTHNVTVTESCSPVASVAITGPTSGTAGQQVTLTANAGNATNPTYMWSPNPATMAGNQATYTLPAANELIVTVTATATCGPSKTSPPHTIQITAACTPVAGVAITGPTSGMPGQQVTLTANVGLPQPTNPTFTWSPNPATMAGNQATYTLPSTNELTVTVTAAASCGPPKTSPPHTIQISTACVPVTNVTLTGPDSGVTDQAYQFIAKAEPPATGPFTYTWDPAPQATNADGTIATYVWDAPGDFDVTVTARNCSGTGVASESLMIPVRVPTVYVVDEDGNPVAGATVYRNGQDAGRTDGAGALAIPDLQPGEELVARVQVYQLDSPSAAHNGWRYRVYLTSLDIPRDGEPAATRVEDRGVTTLTVRKTNTLIGFNLVASVEWEASATYLADLHRVFREGSDYLYDATDGQMLLEQVNIYDDGQHVAEADYRIMAVNGFWNPWRGGATETENPSYGRGFMSAPRWYDDRRNLSPPLIMASTYRPLMRAFGYYGFDLQPSDWGHFYDPDGLGQRRVSGVHCTGTEIVTNNTPDLNATLMAYPLNATEFSMTGVAGLWSNAGNLWTPSCITTRQNQWYRMSDWETIVTTFRDKETPVRWQLLTPKDHGGLVAGPHGIPLARWTPVVVTGDQQRNVCALSSRYRAGVSGNPIAGAAVTLKTKEGRVIFQGSTNTNGEITVVGAAASDTVTFYKILIGNNLHNPPANVYTWTHTVVCSLSRSAAAGSVIEIELQEVPFALDVSATPGDEADEVTVTVTAGTTLKAPPAVSLTQVGEPALPVVMSAGDNPGVYVGQATLEETLGLAGGLFVQAEDTGEHVVEFYSSFEITPVVADTDTTVRSADGQAELFVPAGTLSADGRLVIEPITPLVAPPEGLTIFSGPYSVAPESGVALVSPANLTLHYDPDQPLDETTTQLYRRDGDGWIALDGAPGLDSVSAPINEFGIYALFAKLMYPLYLPISLR